MAYLQKIYNLKYLRAIKTSLLKILPSSRKGLRAVLLCILAVGIVSAHFVDALVRDLVPQMYHIRVFSTRHGLIQIFWLKEVCPIWPMHGIEGSAIEDLQTVAVFGIILHCLHCFGATKVAHHTRH